MGESFGKYQLVSRVARGQIAELFLAQRAGEDGYVAIKRLYAELTSDPAVSQLFLSQAPVATALHHPNIVEVYEIDVAAGQVYIASEFVHGRDLRAILETGIAEDNYIPIELAASLGAQVAAALHHAHTLVDAAGQPMEIVHRDVSPHNILVGVDGTVKLCDFGVAAAEHQLGQISDRVHGKFSYMAPEQIETSEVDPRSDVFALGIVLYETTTMTRLFEADNQYEALEKILYAGIEPPTTLRAGYPAELERIVMRALERDPASRFQSAEEMQKELEAWLVQNQASTSPVPLARYVRGLFPELGRPIGQGMPEVTGPMQVPEEVVAAVDAKPAPPEPEPEPPAPEPAPVKKKDVTEMNEDDLDAALDFALGAPSEASAETPFSVRPDASAAEPAPPAPAEYVDEDATRISERVPEMAELDASPAGRAAAEPPQPAATTAEPPATKPTAPAPEPEVATPPPSEPARPAAAATVAPAPQAEPPAPASVAPAPAASLLPDLPEAPAPGLAAEKSEPAPADRSGAAAGFAPPPAARSGTIPTGPPAAKRPPAAASAESRARAAFGEDDEPRMGADVSLDDIAEPNLSNKKTGAIAMVLVVLALIAVAVLAVRSFDTSGSQIEKEAEKLRIDPDMLIVEVAEKAERVLAAIETTPAEAFVIVNGLPVEVSGGKIPLIKGKPNEVNVYAEGHKPARVVVDGDGSSSPIRVTLEPFAEVPEEERADLRIMSEPRDATVWVDGKEVGKTPTTVTGLWTGVDHHVYIETDGRFPYAGFIGLVKKSENQVQATLAELDSGKKDRVEVTFGAIPRGSTVRVNGEMLGMTSFFKELDRNTTLTVEFEEADSMPMRRHVALEDVGSLELRPFLTPAKREKGTITIFVDPMGPELYVGANAYGQGPAANLVFPEGPVKVVLDTPSGRREVAVEVVPNTHTRYVLSADKSQVTVTKKD